MGSEFEPKAFCTHCRATTIVTGRGTFKLHSYKPPRGPAHWKPSRPEKCPGSSQRVPEGGVAAWVATKQMEAINDAARSREAAAHHRAMAAAEIATAEKFESEAKRFDAIAARFAAIGSEPAGGG